MVDSAKRTEWLHDAKWGVFMHYLGYDVASGEEGIGEWNRRIDAFDVQGLAEQLAAVHARYFWITLGQNCGHFCSPNATYDRITGHSPSMCSRRDLIADLYQALSPKGIRLMVYLPSHAPMHDPIATKALRCVPPWDFSQWSPKPGYYSAADAAGNDERITAFQRNWEAVIREWSLRWGTKVWGWWFDGCYYADRLYRHADEPNFKSFADAARAGNLGSLVAWNPGVINPPVAMDVNEDCTAGEIDIPGEVIIPGRFIQGEQVQILTFIGKFWGTLPISYSADQLIGITRSVTDYGGVITWDVPPTKTGLIDETAFAVLKTVGEAIDATRGLPDKPVPLLPNVGNAIVQGTASASQTVSLRLPISNPHTIPIRGTMFLTAATPGLRIIETPIAYSLAPGETYHQSLPILRAEQGVLESFPAIDVRFADVPHVRTIRISRQIVLPKLPGRDAVGTSPKAVSLDVQQGDAIVANVKLGFDGKNLLFRAAVRDRILLRETPIWLGSCIEFFMAGPTGTPVQQIILVPATSRGPCEVQRFTGSHKGQVSEVPFTTQNTPDGYIAHAAVPIAWLLDTDRVPDTFYLDMTIATSADGKTYERLPLFKSLRAFNSSEGYGHVTIVGTD